MSARFALYLAPEPEEPLWQFGSSWLGYDAETRADLAHPAIADIADSIIREATAHPRLYGLHVTLKAPFRLAADASAENVAEAIAELSQRHMRFGPVALSLEARPAGENHVFLCLAPPETAEALHALEADAVVALDRYRAPLSASELARRNPGALSQRERRYLEKYGYPYILGAFRPHISLTGPIPLNSPMRDALSRKLAENPALMQLNCLSIALFEQPEPGARFHIRERFAFRA
jgi:hypothetical protein